MLAPVVHPVTAIAAPRAAKMAYASPIPEARPAILTSQMREARGTLAPVAPRPQPDAVRVASVPRNELERVVASMRSEIARLRPSKVWCVPFARNASGIDIHGDAWTWWHQVDGEDYAKGHVPVQGAVLNFRPTRVMPLGHVAVVSKVISRRKIMVDQANWIDNKITTDTVVEDVSAKNDWSAVRVENRAHTMGRVNPTYGFIYKLADAS